VVMRGFICSNIVLCAALFGVSAPARAEPGLAGEVYGAGVTKGEAEFELRYGRLRGGDGDGGDRRTGIPRSGRLFLRFASAGAGKDQRRGERQMFYFKPPNFPSARSFSAICTEFQAAPL